jgi:hypothetical protein
MPLFEYAVLRVVPRVEREEFLNVGVILFCPAQGFLQAKFELNEARLTAFAPAQLDLADLRARLHSAGPRAGRLGSWPSPRGFAGSRRSAVPSCRPRPCTPAYATMRPPRWRGCLLNW